ncbi:AbrB/MazE/SpoVT family DNA-binding domain-containing protein [Ruminococcaceae bacterium OttesenSCG-928-L11]|nr:AbrB/MazE/SpoVT family DNA-binding domain-containing protein [Ruminococcaceae bacterium OttesenSCG-928-L11]
MLFLGRHECELDNNYEVDVPQQYRTKLHATPDYNVFWVAPKGTVLICYPVYPPDAELAELDEAPARLPCFDSGKLPLPKQWCQNLQIKPGDALYIVGVGDHLELLSKEQYDAEDDVFRNIDFDELF